MFGGSSKLGRRGGRGVAGMAAKRFSAPRQPQRPSLPSGGRLSLSGGPRNRSPGPASAYPPAVEETFSLVSGNNPLAFAMIIKLVPNLVEEIRRVEARGEIAKIKFDANPKNPSGNIINVGGKEFRFTWSKEFGDLCDIYEKKQSGEDGNGLLVVSGCAWRKLNVQRILDESTTNHVKMLSEEAVRKNKSRKAIVLDHGNSSMKSQIKQRAAVEATPTRRLGFKRKEPPPKKRKVDPAHVSSGGPVKSAYKPGLPSNSKTAGRGGRAISPLASPLEQLQASASPSATVNISKSNAITEDAGPSGQLSKEDATVSEREITAKPSVMVPHRSGDKVNLGYKPMDLQSMLISILRDNPKGMSIKALEEAIGYTIPNSGKKILSRIATYQAPGRYLLKPGVVFEGFKGPSPGSGSSFEDNHNQVPACIENCDETPVPETTSPKEVLSIKGLVSVKPSVRGELDASENVDIEQHSPHPFAVKKKSDHIDRRVDCSSDSGSDSDSDSDSRSDSGSQSKSPVGSGSSSNIDSDASSSLEGSDEDVDILTSDDDKGLKHIVQDLRPAFSSSPLDGRILDIDGADEKRDGHESDIVHIDVIEEGDYRHEATAEEGSSGGKHSLPSVSLYDKPGETRANNLKVIGQIASMQMGSSRKSIDRAGIERPSLVNGRGDAMLQRELSGLELGELCPKEAPLKRPFERKGSFKQSENKSNNLENQSKDLGRVKTPGKLNIDLGKTSPPNLSRKRTLERGEGGPIVPVQQGLQSQLEYLSKGDHGGNVQICKKVNVSKSTIGPQQLGSKRGLVSESVKESKTRAASVATNMSNGQEAVSADYDGGLKRRESSSDENSCSYSKYEKDEPELKGPIKDLQQYMEYAQEYYDKYDNYCSINKILENYRNEFERMGKELHFAKGCDLERYNHVKAQLRDSYGLCGLKHKRLKKIFIVLHVELRHLKQMMMGFAQKYSKGSSC